MLELLHIDWPAKNSCADAQREYVDERHREGIKFRLVVTTCLEISVMEVVSWWENYIGPSDMLQSVEVIP